MNGWGNFAMTKAILLASALAILPAAAVAAPEPAHDCGLEPPEVAALAPAVPDKPGASSVDDLAPFEAADFARAVAGFE